MPAIYNALKVDATTPIGEVQHRAGGADPPPGRPGAHRRHVVDRRPGARHRGRGHRRSHHDAGGPADPGPHLERNGRARRRQAHARDRGMDAHPSPRPGLRHADHHHRDLRDRHQGRRPHRALRQGRQDRPLRRRRRGQDGHHPGAHQQPGPGARRHVGVHGRGRAYPRGHRPVPGDERVRRHQQDLPGVRPDERASGSASARGPGGPHRGRVLPRPGPGRAAVHRQHLPLHAGRLRSVRTAGPHALRRGLPADAGHRDGRPAGAHHFHRPPAPSPRCRPCTCPPTT